MSVVGWVRGRPVDDREVAEYQAGHRPPPAIAHDERAVRRWATRSVLTARLLQAEKDSRGLAEVGELPGVIAAEYSVATTDAEVQSYVLANAHRFSRPERRLVSHVLTEFEPEAAEVARLARQGDGLSSLAERWSLDKGSRSCGGCLGWLGRGEMAGAFEEACFSASPGEVTGPVRSPLGWHVLVVHEVAEAKGSSVVELEAIARRHIEEDRRRRDFANWFTALAARHVVVTDGQEHPGGPSSAVLGHRH